VRQKEQKQPGGGQKEQEQLQRPRIALFNLATALPPSTAHDRGKLLACSASGDPTMLARYLASHR